MGGTGVTRRAAAAALGACAFAPLAHADDDAAPLIAYERASGGCIGVFAQNVATGRSFAWRAQARFVMCSTFKASLAALVLGRVDRGLDDLAAEIRYGEGDLQPYAPAAREHLARGAMSVSAMCEAAVALSDNTCANLLLARVGGPAALTAFWRAHGDAVSRLDHDEPLLNRTPPGGLDDTTTPHAMADTLRRLALGDALAPASRERLVGWMVEGTTGLKRLRAGVPAGWRVADKTGNNARDAFGDIAVAWPPSGGPIVVCAYTRGGTPTEGQVESVFAAIGRNAAARLA